MWAVCMETYLEALDLWEAIEEDYKKIQPLPANPIEARMKSQKEKKTKKIKGKSMPICMSIFLKGKLRVCKC